jgi:hypothetical protein
MSFWQAPSGKKITGNPEDSFAQAFTTIPEGTSAVATVKKFEVVNKEASQYGAAQKYIQVTYKLLDGDFKNREVQQKIKCFEGKPEQIERNLNMLMRVMKLCSYTPTHNNEPTTAELNEMVGNIVGIVIGEWSMPKADGSGVMEGNFVREVHESTGFVAETGVKAEVVHTNPAPESAFSRDKARRDAELDGDVPF